MQYLWSCLGHAFWGCGVIRFDGYFGRRYVRCVRRSPTGLRYVNRAFGEYERLEDLSNVVWLIGPNPEEETGEPSA